MSKVRIIFLVLFSSFFLSDAGAAEKLSDQAKMSLLTCSPGSELYSVFGHSAIRVTDPSRGLDSIYNYGTFDFYTDNFYMKFSRGKLDYILSKQDYPGFMYAYLLENRSVREAEFNFDQAQLQEVYDLLEHNYLPENRAYRYDFFYDNCSTRIKEILKTAFGDELKFDLPEQHEITFRDQVEKYTHNMPWSLFGISIALGAPYNRKMAAEDIMFLPDELEKGFVDARLNGHALVKSPVEILNREKVSEPYPVFNHLTLGILLALISVLYWFFLGRNSGVNIWKRLLLLLIGLAGMLALLLWIATDHYATKPNWNILWLFPLNAFVWPFLKRNASNWQIYYFKGTTILLVLSAILVGLGEFPLYYLPFILALFFFYLPLSKKQGV